MDRKTIAIIGVVAAIIVVVAAFLVLGNGEDDPGSDALADSYPTNLMIMGNANLDDYLVYARTGYAMIERRGGWAYYKKYKSGRKKILDTGYISKWDYYKTVGVQLIVALVPKKIRLFIFTKLLR